MLLLFLWVFWFFLLFRIIGDLFRDHELSGWAKAGWLILVVVLPFLGVLVYVIVRGEGMAKRDRKQLEARDAAFRQYVRETAGGEAGGRAGGVDELARLADMKARGDLTEEEFARAKAKFLG